jgi:Icc-related predicted phosphoesterase
MRLEIPSTPAHLVHEVRYLNAARGGGTETARLPIVRGTVRGLPEGIDALVATGDLQGIVPDHRTRAAVLLGVAVARELEELGDRGLVPRAPRTGVLLAGDLYSVPGANKRGGHGDVAEVWAAFAERFAWVAGVAGNHDDVSGVASCDGTHLLDGEDVSVAGLRIGGVGLVRGNPEKPGRRDVDEQLAQIELVAERHPDVLVLHEGPSGDGNEQLGHQDIREVVARHRVPLTVCGHVHWRNPLASHAGGQIVNVDGRVVVLARVPSSDASPVVG